MLLAFFMSKGLIHTHMSLRDAMINADYIINILSKFLEHTYEEEAP